MHCASSISSSRRSFCGSRFSPLPLISSIAWIASRQSHKNMTSSSLSNLAIFFVLFIPTRNLQCLCIKARKRCRVLSLASLSPTKHYLDVRLSTHPRRQNLFTNFYPPKASKPLHNNLLRETDHLSRRLPWSLPPLADVNSDPTSIPN